MAHFFRNVVLLALVLVPAAAIAADEIVTEYPIASVVAGRAPDTAKPVYEQMVVALALPEAQRSKEEQTGYELCTRAALGGWGYQEAKAIDETPTGPFPVDAFPRFDTTVVDLARAYDPGIPSTELTPALVTKTKADRISAIDTWLRDQVPVIRQKVQQRCGGLVPKGVLEKMRILISMRRCPVPAPTEQFHPCNMIGLEGTRTVPVRERGYSQLLAWMQSQGVRPENQWIDFSSGKPGTIVPVTGVLAGMSRATWTDVSLEERLAEFENQVEYLRKLPEDAAERVAGISASIPRVIGMTQESAARVIDLLQSPIQAAEGLPTGDQVFARISDEVARTRIMECVRLRAVNADNVTALATCSGYATTAHEVMECLNGLRCMPKIGPKAMAAVLHIVDRADLSKLAEITELPRIGDLQRDAWQSVARQCAIDKKDVPEPEEYERLAMECTLRKGLRPGDLATFNCASSAKNDADLLKCLPNVPPQFQAAATCFQDNQKDPKKGVWCAARSNLPAPVANCLGAYESGATGQAVLESCLTAEFPDAARVQNAMKCTREHINPTEAALCIAAPELPKDLQGLAKCGMTASQGWESYAGCAAQQYVPMALPGDLGRLAECSVQSSGDPLGTGVCMVDTGLNPTQQIILQCAATTGGEPLSFATCSGGRLALKEFIQCKDVRFAQDKCFGENNEIRKFVRALGLPDIGPNSVVAQAANIPLDMLKYQVRYAETVFKLGGDVLAEGGRALEHLGHGLEHLGQETERVIRGVGGAFERGGREIGRSVCRVFGC